MTQNLISASSLFQILIKESLLRRFMCWLKDLFLIHSQVKSFQIALDCGAKVCVFRLKSDEEWIKMMITPWIMKKFSCIQLYEDSHRSHYSPGPWTDRTRPGSIIFQNRAKIRTKSSKISEPPIRRVPKLVIILKISDRRFPGYLTKT